MTPGTDFGWGHTRTDKNGQWPVPASRPDHSTHHPIEFDDFDILTDDFEDDRGIQAAQPFHPQDLSPDVARCINMYLGDGFGPGEGTDARTVFTA